MVVNSKQFYSRKRCVHRKREKKIENVMKRERKNDKGGGETTNMEKRE
jgi:hypothetical protein